MVRSVRSKNIIMIFLSIVFSGLIYCLIIIDPFSRYEYVVMKAYTQQDTLISAYGRTGLLKHNNFLEHHNGAAVFTTGKWRDVRIPLKNRISPYVKIKVNKKTSVTIASLRLVTHFGKEKIYQGEELWQLIGIEKDSGRKELTDQGVRLDFAKRGGEFQLHGPLRVTNFWYAYGVPVVVGFLCFLFLKNIKVSSFSIYRDLLSSHIKQHIYRRELDGLRGVAALFVLLEHTWFKSFHGFGRTGVWLFFLLSGYLLSQPFVSKPERAVTIEYLTGYLRRRILRILPMYLFTLILFFAVSGAPDLILIHLLFMQGEGHFWTIPQEIYFYLCLPLLMVFVYFIGKLSAAFRVVTIFIACSLLLYKPEIIPFHYFASGMDLPIYFGWFLTGSCVAYLNPEKSFLGRRYLTNTFRSVLAYLGVLLLAFLILFSLPSFGARYFAVPQVFPLVHMRIFGVGCAVLLFLILLTPDTLLSRIFSWLPFRAIGIVGFSFYLLHPIIIAIIHDVSLAYFNRPLTMGPGLFVVSLFATWIAATVTYSLIERPFMKRRE